MQHTLACPPPETTDFGSSPSFNVLLAYEDFETGKRAKRTYDFLVENLGHDCRFSNQMWKFEVLSIPKLREIAAADAVAADLVVISCHGDELPAQVKAWIESWLATNDAPLALVALFDRSAETSERTRRVRAYLAEVARRGHMEFFAQPDEWSGSKNRLSSEHDQSSDLTRRALSALAGAGHSDVSAPRWSFSD